MTLPRPATTTSDDLDVPDGVVSALVDSRRRFLAFVESKVGTRADAEEILQAAFVRAVDAVDELNASESAVAWFYRILRNGIIDHYRRRAAEGRVLERITRELPENPHEAAPDISQNVCACISDLMTSLPPAQGALLRQVDLEERPIHAVAAEMSISAGNARVRLHRARQALRERVNAMCGACADHGCLSCTCRGLTTVATATEAAEPRL